MGEPQGRTRTRDRVGLVVVSLLLVTTTVVELLDLTATALVEPSATLAIALAAVACASLTTTGALAFRIDAVTPSLAFSSATVGVALIGVGTIETALRASAYQQDPVSQQSRVAMGFAVVAWLGRGLLTAGLAAQDRKVGRRASLAVLGVTTLGIAGVLRRGGDGLPSDLERLAASLLAISLLVIALRWMVTTRSRSAAYGSVAFLAAGVALALLLGSTTRQPGDTKELAGLAWLILTGLLAAAWLDRAAAERRAERDQLTFDALRAAEDQRVRLESAQLEQSIVRHDSRSSLTAVEGGVQAIVGLHQRGEDAKLLRMSAMVLAELGRIRRLLDGSAQVEVSDLAAVLDPLLALHRAAGLDVEVDLKPSDVVVAMPADSLAQVVENILRNCEVHAPGATVRIAGRTAVGGERLLLSFKDNGPGIDPVIVPQLFVPQASSPARHGLGLPVVERLVSAAGGTVELEPAFVGTTVRLDLPVHDAPVGQVIELRSGQREDPDDRHPAASVAMAGHSASVAPAEHSASVALAGHDGSVIARHEGGVR